jgi:hypothetical protein
MGLLEDSRTLLSSTWHLRSVDLVSLAVLRGYQLALLQQMSLS